MKSKIIRYSTILIPLFILMIYLLRERSPFGGSNTAFAVKSGKEITRIELKNLNSTLLLEKKGEEWLVNKKFKTRKSSILFILKILKEMDIKSPVTQELFDKEIIKNNIAPVKVKVYGKGRLLKSFNVYKTQSNNYGNIMKLREGSKPFIIAVPGYEAEIGSAFSLNELFWQPYTVFNLLPSEIYSVTLENYIDTSSSFKIKNENRKLILYARESEQAGWDTSRVLRYLSYFTNVPFETWAFGLSDVEKKKIINGTPIYRMTVVNTTGEIKILTLWNRSVDEKGTILIDTDKLWAKTNDIEEIFIIKYNDIDPLLKKRSYFFPG